MPTVHNKEIKQFISGELRASVTFNKSDQTVTIKDANRDLADFRVEDFTTIQMTNYLALITAINTEAATLFT